MLFCTFKASGLSVADAVELRKALVNSHYFRGSIDGAMFGIHINTQANAHLHALLLLGRSADLDEARQHLGRIWSLKAQALGIPYARLSYCEPVWVRDGDQPRDTAERILCYLATPARVEQIPNDLLVRSFAAVKGHKLLTSSGIIRSWWSIPQEEDYETTGPVYRYGYESQARELRLRARIYDTPEARQRREDEQKARTIILAEHRRQKARERQEQPEVASYARQHQVDERTAKRRLAAPNRQRLERQAQAEAEHQRRSELHAAAKKASDLFTQTNRARSFPRLRRSCTGVSNAWDCPVVLTQTGAISDGPKQPHAGLHVGFEFSPEQSPSSPLFYSSPYSQRACRHEAGTGRNTARVTPALNEAAGPPQRPIVGRDSEQQAPELRTLRVDPPSVAGLTAHAVLWYVVLSHGIV